MSAKNIKKYKNPPLIEAVIEIHFEAKDFSTKTFFEFWALVNSEYPEVTSRAPVQRVVVNADGSTSILENRMDQFWNPQKTNLIQLSANLLTVNCLPEYQGWDFFKERIIGAVDNLYKVVKLQKIARIDLRTINKIDLGAHKIENVKEYFTVFPNSPGKVFDNTTAVQLQIETKEPDDSASLLTMATTVKEEKYHAPLLFQLAYVRVTPIEKIKLNEWLETAHTKLGLIFESILTKKAKETFNQ